MPAVRWSHLVTCHINSQSLTEVLISGLHLYRNWTVCVYCRNFCKEKTYRKYICKLHPKKVVCIQACEKVAGERFSKWHKEEIEEDCADWWKGSGYWGMITDQSSKSVKMLSTGNRCFARICFHSHKINRIIPYKITVVHELKQYGAMKILMLYS
jgi:hypothetical protein